VVALFVLVHAVNLVLVPFVVVLLPTWPMSLTSPWRPTWHFARPARVTHPTCSPTPATFPAIVPSEAVRPHDYWHCSILFFRLLNLELEPRVAYSARLSGNRTAI
jgi:hypothetical protein